jgi:type I restriction enzyme S subunit
MMHINRGPFLEHAVLLPPLAEQHRIVATVEELIALCDQLEAAQNDRESQRSALLSAALHRLTTSENGEGNDSDIGFFLKSSPRLMTRPEHLDGVRQAILDLAVQGRLVRQVPEDAPASDFLQHSQNASGYSDEFSDDKPLPPGWGKATVGQLSSMVTSGSRGWAEFYSETGSAFIRAQNIRFGQLRLDDLAHVTLPERHEGKRTKADRGDILIVITGAGVTNPALLEIDMADAYVSQHVGLVKLRSKEIAPWILLCLMARKGCRDDLVSRAYGAGKPGLNLDNIRTLVAPVPPLAEQRRIIAKVSELMTVCDELETALDSANHERVRILDALLHDVLSERDGPATPVMALAGT